jgi:SAM-dependent methyltransferase
MKLEPDGERMIVEHYRSSASDYLIYLFHEVSYRFAQPFAAGRDVLDLGCGSGYGTAMLAEQARSVVGVDVSTAAISHAQTSYSRPNASFRSIAPDERLPFETASFDTVICFQVIEHVGNEDQFVSEIFRVLRPEGVAVLATPDRSTRLFPGQKPWNRWHLREYSDESLHRLLAKQFPDVTIQFMSGAEDIIAVELDRCRRLKWMTLPFTAPFVPEPLRVAGLSGLRWLKDTLTSRPPAEPADFSFTVEDLWIGPSPQGSTNLVAVARKSSP